MSQFVQLTSEDCKYLLELIQEMDSSTKYTERQRSYTVPKLEKILKDPRSVKLAYQDVDYLLDLIEDDDLEESADRREQTRSVLLDIQALQQMRFEETKDIEQQRELRRAKRNPQGALSEHFERTTV